MQDVYPAHPPNQNCGKHLRRYLHRWHRFVYPLSPCELLFGLAKRTDATRLHIAVRQFLLRVDVLQCDSPIAQRYGSLRSEMERKGKTLAPLDLLIAAHALGVGAVLVTSDGAFKHVSSLKLEDWAD